MAASSREIVLITILLNCCFTTFVILEASATIVPTNGRSPNDADSNDLTSQQLQQNCQDGCLQTVEFFKSIKSILTSINSTLNILDQRMLRLEQQIVIINKTLSNHVQPLKDENARRFLGAKENTEKPTTVSTTTTTTTEPSTTPSKPLTAKDYISAVTPPPFNGHNGLVTNTGAKLDSCQIVKRPKDLRVRAGSIATFYCRVTGDPPPQVHWRKNGKKVSPAHSRIVINNYGGVAMLRIEPTRDLRDEATYECMAENGVGDQVTAQANLTVFAEMEVPEGFPVITDPPMTKVVEKGSTATLTCKATGTPPLRVYWLKDLLPLTLTKRLLSLGFNGEILQITNVREADAGSYDCFVENSVGTESSPTSGRIYVKERRVPPEFSLPPNPVYEVKRGDELKLTCVAIGSPMPAVQWRRGTESLTPEDAIPIGKNILTLVNIQETAVYTCTATSRLGTTEVNTTVKILSLPNPPSKVRVSDVTASSVRLSWYYEPDEMEDVTFYVIQYKPKYSESLPSARFKHT